MKNRLEEINPELSRVLNDGIAENFIQYLKTRLDASNDAGEMVMITSAIKEAEKYLPTARR